MGILYFLGITGIILVSIHANVNTGEYFLLVAFGVVCYIGGLLKSYTN